MTAYRIDIINTDKKQRVAKISGSSFADVMFKLDEEFRPGPRSIFGNGEILKELSPGENSILRRKKQHHK
jgi:hypothetical protein